MKEHIVIKIEEKNHVITELYYKQGEPTGCDFYLCHVKYDSTRLTINFFNMTILY